MTDEEKAEEMGYSGYSAHYLSSRGIQIMKPSAVIKVGSVVTASGVSGYSGYNALEGYKGLVGDYNERMKRAEPDLKIRRIIPIVEPINHEEEKKKNLKDRMYNWVKRNV